MAGVEHARWVQLCSDIADSVERPRWHSLAACRDASPDLFFPVGCAPGVTRAALELCRRCPVQPECLAAAVGRRERNGVWGGVVFGAKPARRVEVA